MKAKKFIATTLAAATCLAAVGCSPAANGTENPQEPVTEIRDFTDENFVNLYGRTYYNEDMRGIAFVNSASGFEVRFCGTNLVMNAQSAGAWESMFSVFVDGEEDSNARVVVVENSPFGNYNSVVLAQNLSDTEHTVKVFKRTPSNRDTTLISSVSTDGEFLPAPERPAIRMDVYGDSITCGEGIMREVRYDAATGRYEDSKVYTAFTQNVMQTYAAVAAQKLGAEFRVYGRGGIAMKYPYAGTKHTVLENPAAVAVDLDPGDYPYDYASWTPDVVVIYLGTNDYGARGVNADYSLDGLKTAFAQFITEIVGRYYGKEIPIVLCSGMMAAGSGLGQCMRGVKSMLVSQFPNLDTVEFSPCAVGHPVVEENRVAGELLAAKISELIIR